MFSQLALTLVNSLVQHPERNEIMMHTVIYLKDHIIMVDFSNNTYG